MQSDDLDNPPKPLRSLADELKASIHSRPDKNTLAWWEGRFQEILQAYKGASHSINLAVGNTRDNEARLKTFAEMIENFKGELDAVRCDMGEIQAENTMLKEDIVLIKAEMVIIQKRIADMADWAAKKGKQLPDQRTS
jgi:hypothetical protein